MQHDAPIIVGEYAVNTGSPYFQTQSVKTEVAVTLFCQTDKPSCAGSFLYQPYETLLGIENAQCNE